MRKIRLSRYKQGRLIEHFVSGSTARTAASIVGINKTTSAYFYHRSSVACAKLNAKVWANTEIATNTAKAVAALFNRNVLNHDGCVFMVF